MVCEAKNVNLPKKQKILKRSVEQFILPRGNKMFWKVQTKQLNAKKT